jgi:hypothetical protein
MEHDAFCRHQAIWQLPEGGRAVVCMFRVRLVKVVALGIRLDEACGGSALSVVFGRACVRVRPAWSWVVLESPLFLASAVVASARCLSAFPQYKRTVQQQRLPERVNNHKFMYNITLCSFSFLSEGKLIVCLSNN